MSATTQFRCLVWRDGCCTERTASATHTAAELRDPASLVWLDIVDADANDLAWIAAEFGLWPTEVEDALAAHERPKVSRHGEHLFFTTYAARLTGDPGGGPDGGPTEESGAAGAFGDDGTPLGHLSLFRVSGFVLPTALITIRERSFDMDTVIAQWRENDDLVERDHTPAALVHGLLDAVVDEHFDVIQRLDDAIESLEDELFEERRTGREFLRRVYGLRKDLVTLRRVVLPMREVVSGLIRHRLHDGSELGSWFDDLYDHVLRAAEWTESLRDMVTSVFETNLSLQDARLNMVMKKLAAWAAIIAVPTAVTGWFGQNVPYPGFSQPSGFWASVVLILVLSVGLYAVFRRRDWL